MIKYVITRRCKTQTNKKRNNLTEADFHYWWSNHINENMVFSKSKAAEQAAGYDYYNSLAEAQQELAESESYQYGHRIWRVELLEEHEQDKAYQADTHKVPV